MADIVMGWFVVPAAIGSMLGSLVTLAWQHFSAKELRALESRLRKQEESYRLLQSPRVAAAIDLWCAFCGFERALRRKIYPSVRSIDIDDPSGMANMPDDKELAGMAAEEVRAAWAQLELLRDKAEILLSPNDFATFDATFRAYFKAHDTRWAQKVGIGAASVDALSKEIAEAGRLREVALVALKTMIEASEAKR